MNELPADLRGDHNRAPSPAIWVALFVSMLLHALMIWGWLPRQHQWSPENARPQSTSSRLQVQLAPQAASSPPPPPAAAPAPPVRAQPPARKQAPPPMTAPRSPARPPALALNRLPEREPTPPVPPPAESRPAPQAAGDLSSYIAARQRARGEAAPYDPTVPAPPAEKPRDPRDQIVASNLGLDRTPTFGDSAKAGGGIFQIRRMGYDDAEFLFFGWNKDIRRNSAQVIEVRKGGNSNMQIAVVRRMIEIIRENTDTDGDFLWISHRLDRELTLSARPEDTAGLEDFLMQEFFGKQARQ
jgi:hypothetical protein